MAALTAEQQARADAMAAGRPPLDEAQTARAEAVKIAAAALRRQTGFAQSQPGDATAVRRLAEWILTGEPAD